MTPVHRYKQLIQRPGNEHVAGETDPVAHDCRDKQSSMGQDVLRSLFDVPGDNQPGINRKLSIADRIKQVAESGQSPAAE